MSEQIDGPELSLWRVRCGTISKKPVRVIDLGGGFIKVVGSCLTKQELYGRYESYHGSHLLAVAQVLADAERDVEKAKRELKNSQRRLANVQKKYCPINQSNP